MLIHGEANAFELLGYVITDRHASSIAVTANKEDHCNRLVLVLPLSIGALRCSQRGHLVGNDLFGLIRVVGVLGFQAASNIRQVGIVRAIGLDREVFGQAAASIDFLVDVVAIIQPVRGLADLPI